MGRQTSDQVPTLGAGVDGTVPRIDTAYEIRGMVSRSTSYGNLAGTSFVNQVSLAFGEFEQQTGETQDNSATGGPVSVVGYGYNTGGTSNSIAPLSLTYPDGAKLLYEYTATDDIPLDRVTSLSLAAATVASYAYFGLASFASVTYGTSPAINTTLATGAPSIPVSTFSAA